MLEYELQPSVINVDHQITYQEAQAVLERDNSDTLKALDIKPKDLKALAPHHLNLMDNLLYLCQAIKRQRLQRGAFELNLPEYDFPDDAGELLPHYRSPKFQYDDEGLLGVIVTSSKLPSRAIVTECMLLANAAGGRTPQSPGGTGPFIVCIEPPNRQKVQELVKLAENMTMSAHLRR